MAANSLIRSLFGGFDPIECLTLARSPQDSAKTMPKRLEILRRNSGSGKKFINLFT
jgi:hypothetical protein